MESENRLDNEFISDSFSHLSYKKDGGFYSGSNAQLATYEKVIQEDNFYKSFITKTYGSYENYKNINKIFKKGSVYDPSVDYKLDVTVITDEAYYRTDHISASEVIMESLSGICSFNFVKKDGSTAKVNGTLEEKYMPTTEFRRRGYFFSPQANDRIVVWDINKQHWASFYMNKLFKFVRDDTTDLE